MKDRTCKITRIPDFLVSGYQAWKETSFLESQDEYQDLVSKGQKPKTMVIGCCDSRVQLSALFSARPGELFIHRNIGNLVPQFAPDSSHHGTSATVEYAVEVLKVQHIVVMGHSDCGGIRACNDMFDDKTDKAVRNSFVSTWLGILDEGFNRVKNISNRNSRVRALEFISVVTSLENLLTYPFVINAIMRGDLNIHGLWQNISEGQLMSYDGQLRQFVQVN